MRISGITGLVALLLALAGPAVADVERGWQAFLKGDYDTALDQLEPAAEAGDATAQYYLGVLYDHGEGVLRNYRTATGWYEKAAAQGNSDAQFNLGMIYYNGTGDPGAAGHPMANYFMCQLLDEGKVVERDLSRALAYCREAADSGIAGAQFNTGLLLAERSNEVATWREAYTWFLLAKRAHYPGAEQNLEAVKQYLDAGDISQAEAMADAWAPATPAN
jgi:TPR repeat protein